MENKNTIYEQDFSPIEERKSFFLTLLICLAVFFTATGLLIAFFNRLISRHDQRLSAEICTIMSEKMNLSIEFMTEAANDMASVLSVVNFSSCDEIYETIKKNKNSDYVSAGFVDASGRIYAEPEEISEFDKWELMNTASQADPVSMSAPYRSSIYGQPVITLFSRFGQGTPFQGYMFTTYKFSVLQQIALTHSLENDIEIWLMNADSGNVIQCAAPDAHAIGGWTNAYLAMQGINEGDVPVYKEWLDRTRQRDDNIGISYSIGEVIYSQHCAAIKSMPGWYVVVRIPSNALSDTMHTFRNNVIIFLAVLLVVVIVLIANMYRMSKRDNEILKKLSTHDPLTGVLNRRAFDLAARQWLSRGNDCALIYFDLDYFKQVNDGFGHDVGDRLLVFFSDSLKKCFSDTGVISRFGGDEFVVLADMENADDINKKIAQIREDIAGFEFDRDNGSMSAAFSSGAARFPYDSDALMTLMKQADTALYEVKERGRNGFMWYTDLNMADEEEQVSQI